MNPTEFDSFVTSLIGVGTRRRVFRALLALPFAGVLPALSVESDARGRRHAAKHRRARDRDQIHDEKKRKKKKKKRPVPCAQVGQTPVAGQTCCAGLVRDSAGQCVQSTTPTCAQAGQTPATGQTCCTGLVLDGAGQCSQPAPPSCAISCSGCCNGETCITATSASACGASGAPCGVCSGLQRTCFNGSCHCDVCATGCRFSSVQVAIDDPGALTTITICEGTYAGDISINRNLTLRGAGDGADLAFNTILDGTGTTSVVTTGASASVTLQRLRITGGNANQGGGVFIAGGTHTMTECTVFDNDAITSGAGIYNAGTLTMNACKVTSNTSGGTGGGIYSTNSLTATDLAVSRNLAGLGGGGIANSGNLQLENSSIISNFAGGGFIGGGGILNSDTGTVTLIATDVGLNTASGATVGGGIQQSGTLVTLSGIDNKVLGNVPTNCGQPTAVVGCDG